MATFPTPNVHRRSRRKLGRGQYPLVPSVGVTAAYASPRVTLTFDQPVVVSGNIPLAVTGHALISQTNSTPQSVLQYFGTPNLAGVAYSLPANAANVKTAQGGGNAAASGTF